MTGRGRVRRAVAPVEPGSPARSAAPGFAPPLASLAAVPARPAVQRRCSACAGEKDELPVQARLEVGAADDRHEREADGIAAQMMGEARPAAPVVQRRAGAGGGETIAASHGDLASGGAPLPESTRQFFESRMGRDLSGVRVHEGTGAAALNASIRARAFTYRNHVWLGRRERAAPSFTMAHELAHVAQQTAPGPVGPQVSARREIGAAPASAQRAPAAAAAPATGAGCSLNLAFAPIAYKGLGTAGLVHAIISTGTAAGTEHSEVVPFQHDGAADPLYGGVSGRTTGTHSHVATSAGAGAGTTTVSIAATCAQVAAVRASVKKYEALDVRYDAPPGPNSNSFAEWVLNDAGIPTAAISTPVGALGWSYYISNPGERAKPPSVVRTASDTKCATAPSRATSFRALVDLIRKAEIELIACGVADAGERASIIRGIYYGTPWSKDYDTSEKSHVRNQMFNIYSGTTQPRYAMECLDCGTFLSLGASQDVTDGASARKVDVGHMFIGMDARRSAIARNATQPIGGVTGLEASTWAGDLGGGAARLSVDRIAAPTASPMKYFKGSDYGGPINLEGDVAGYQVGAAGSSTGSAAPLTLGPGQGVADAVEAYLLGAPATKTAAAGTPGRNGRCTGFLTAMGGTFNSTGGLTNRAAVVSYIANQTESFGCWYLVNYMRQHGGVDLVKAEEAAHHIVGASQEMAGLFVTALENCATKGAEIAVTGSTTATPRATSASCWMALNTAKFSVKSGKLIDDGKKSIDEMQRDLGREIDRKRRELRKWWDSQ
ncbi:MAG TPA: DUF4157 domain-containing protein [Allosphingosinicella sp.]|nr:DUF4157 domain-containing protein [Allosphingosinicella sp.]